MNIRYGQNDIPIEKINKITIFNIYKDVYIDQKCRYTIQNYTYLFCEL